jgi:hypothetical protein
MYNEILMRLKEYKPLEEEHLSDGTHLIGKAPHIAPLAWLHTIYPGLTDENISELEEKIGVSIPDSYKDFLRLSNGLNVFNTTLSLFGLRKNYDRSHDQVWQPFDILTPNLRERPENARSNVFIIGSYDWDGSYLFIDRKTNKVHLCDRDDAASLYEWPNLEVMLRSEIDRLITLFDKNGKELYADTSTLPIDY